LLLVASASGPRAQEAFNLPTPSGAMQPILFTGVAKPSASLILFPSGFGLVRAEHGNFLIRVMPQFAAVGFNIALADTPSDQPNGMSDQFRMSDAEAEDIAVVIAFLRQCAAVPVWLVGTSRGTISTTSIGVKLGPPRVAGVVLTSTLWLKVIPQVPLEQLRVPTLVVHNRDDGCWMSPFSAASAGFARLSAVPSKQLIVVFGGMLKAHTDSCEAMSQHGYYGIEGDVVSAIAG
jgi:pimeloyl-ACP methyl ester carboxylesterase